MADLRSNNSFDSNMGAGLGPAYGADMSFDYSSTAFTSVNAASIGSARTVSPKDVFADPLASTPASAAFTNLTTPDLNDSPYLSESFTSPMFTTEGDFGGANPQDWFPLFDSSEMKSEPFNTIESVPLERGISSDSLARSSPLSNTDSPFMLDAASRRKSSVTASPAPTGISKPRRRKGPLPPIAVDPNDKVALKRARNTLAARDSRQRKFDYVNSLEKQISDLTSEASDLRSEVEKWKSIALNLGFKPE